MKLTPARDSSYSRRMQQPWQMRALSYYDAIGEIRFASQFYAKLLSKVRYYPARQLESGDTEPIEDGLPVEILHRIQDPGGGRSRLQYDYGRMQFVTGEGVLFGDRLGTDEERWRFLWTEEIRRTDDGLGWQRVRYDGVPYDPPQVGEAYRMWTPHPRHSDLPDSPLHSVMDIAEELLILTAAVRSTAVSRMTKGILKMPSELSPNPYGAPGSTSDPYSDAYQGDEDPETNPFLDDLIEHTEAEVENPGSASAAVPFIFEGAYEYLDRVEWMATHDNQTDYMERELRKEAVHRLALGMDFPPEFLLGMTDANHWTARQVVFDMWRSYGTPIAERFADDLNDSFLKKSLELEGYEGWQDVVIAYDDSEVVISPDKTQVAKEALEMIAISRDGYREMASIPAEFAPDDEEEAFLASLKLRQPVEVEDGDLVIPQRGPVAQQNGSSPENGPPAPSGGREGSRQEARTASARIHGAAELALQRCRELAGARIRLKCSECAEGHPNALVASVMGEKYVTDPLKLVQGGSESLHSWLQEQGFESVQTASLCQQLEVYAARTLFQPRCPELPSGLVAALAKAEEVSSALASRE